MAFLKKIDMSTLKSTLETSVKAAQESVSNIDIDGIVQGAKDAVTAGAEKIGDVVEGITGKKSEEQDNSSTKELIALLWCLAYVDGVITDDEKATLSELSHSLDEEYQNYAEEIEEKYVTKLQEASKEFGEHTAAKIEAQRIVESIETNPEDAKLLCWNLLALANSDGLDEDESDFIRFVSEKAGIEPAVFDELRNYSDAIVEIGKSIEELRLSNKSYVEIEPLVQEFTNRQQKMLDAIQSLITDR